MNPDWLLQYFERIAEAPDAVPRLRRFILDLAVRGKIVQQDPNDEPASELLKRMQGEKVQTAKTGRINKHKSVPQLDQDAILPEVPASWEWVPIRGITSDQGQKVPDRKFSYIDVSSIDNSLGRITEAQVLLPDAAPSRARKIVKKGDVIYSCVRPYLLNIAIVDHDFEPEPIVSTAFAVLHSFSAILPRYLWLVLRSPIFVTSVEEKMRGQAYPAINDRDFAPLPIPLPPLAEQHRIVAKVDELMSLCDDLEATQTKREKRRDRLVAATLHGLNNGNGSSEHDFRNTTRFYFKHLARLTTRTEHIQQLRQTILNLAVRGRLVPQDHNDEPALELLTRIRHARRQINKSERTIEDRTTTGTYLAHKAPKNWETVRFSELLISLQTGPFGSTLHKRDYEKGGVPVINPASIQSEKIVPIDEMAVGQGTLERLAAFKMKKGDVIMGRRGEMGRCAVVSERENGWLCGTGSLILRFTNDISPYFIVKLMKAPSIREYLGRASVGATMQNLNQSILKDMVIGLPPLAEQHRIVAKVDELMALCDELEAQLTSTATTRTRLLEATIHEALSGQCEFQ